MPLGFAPAPPTDHGLAYQPVSYADVPGWHQDDHAAALAAFLGSCAAVVAQAETGKPQATAALTAIAGRLASVCRQALVLARDGQLGPSQARTFFEAQFTPHRMLHTGAEGLLTGYYEPELEGSLKPGGRFRFPVYRRPPELVNLVSEAERGSVGSAFTHARQRPNGSLETFETRQEIETGALEGRSLELVWLADPVDCFFLHIQGSGLIRLPDGTGMRITYDGKNGHPYTSVGRYLIDNGAFSPDDMSLDALKAWLAADPVRGRQAMWQNRSFIFFRALRPDEADSALGVMQVALSPGRSLAVDVSAHVIGSPVFVEAPTLTHASGTGAGFARLMVAQDVGSAIRGPERGDIYFGTGFEAGALAGITKHAGRFIVLLPKAFAGT